MTKAILQKRVFNLWADVLCKAEENLNIQSKQEDYWIKFQSSVGAVFFLGFHISYKKINQRHWIPRATQTELQKSINLRELDETERLSTMDLGEGGRWGGSTSGAVSDTKYHGMPSGHFYTILFISMEKRITRNKGLKWLQYMGNYMQGKMGIWELCTICSIFL